jgi:hypothetical protein
MSWETNELDTQYEDKLRTERQEEGTNYDRRRSKRKSIVHF